MGGRCIATLLPGSAGLGVAGAWEAGWVPGWFGSGTWSTGLAGTRLHSGAFGSAGGALACGAGWTGAGSGLTTLPGSLGLGCAPLRETNGTGALVMYTATTTAIASPTIRPSTRPRNVPPAASGHGKIAYCVPCRSF